VGLYLSGGIDSSTIAAMTTDANRSRREAFSIAFPEPGFDESDKTRRVAEFLDVPTHFLTYHQRDLAADLPHLVYHGESPLISTESAPLLALSGLARKHVKVVLTGEGADEALGGYLYFRWEAIKHLVGPGLMGWILNRLIRPYFAHYMGPRNPFVPQPQDFRWAQEVFGCYPAIMMKFFFFRMVRDMVYSREMLDRQRDLCDAEFLELPRENMRRWDQYNRTLYLSSRIFMTGHLLGSHGDRALMANSVEGRYPFLDRQVQEFLGQVPPAMKTGWLTEKYLLRRAMAKRLPREVIRCQKKPFLAPFGTPFIGEDATDHVRELLSPRKLAEFGYFDPVKVQGIVDYLQGSKAAIAEDRGDSIRPNRQAIHSVVMGMALTFVVSTQALEDHVRQGRFDGARPLAAETFWHEALAGRL
jgi:asparagine synthase (glutamine-hydrolysing)